MPHLCPQCFDEHPDVEAWKAHMTATHGGWTDDEKIAAGITDEADNARGALGDRELNDVPDMPPSKTPPRPVPIAPRGKGKTASAKNSSVIGRIIIKRLARLPYAAWAALVHDPRMDLSKEEREELTSMYMEIVSGMDVDFSSPKWAFLAAFSVNADFILVRLGYMGVTVPGMDDEPAEVQP